MQATNSIRTGRGKKNSAKEDRDLETALNTLSELQSMAEIRSGIERITRACRNGKIDIPVGFAIEAIERDFEQISSAFTAERAHYYLKRLKKSISESHVNHINDMDMNRWKEYGEVITDSLWIFSNREKSGTHNAKYWGNFVPQIPHQLLLRYTKKGETVLDPFAGNGTTLIECKRLGRNCLGIDISREATSAAIDNVSKEEDPYSVNLSIVNGDSRNVNFDMILNQMGLKKVQLIILHPPYWDIIKFTDNKDDLSNSVTQDNFLESLGKVVEKTYPLLEKGRFLALIIGDKYSRGEWLPLGFQSMEKVMQSGFRLKSIIVKNFEDTRGKKGQKELWRYRALSGGFYVFKHEYIFIFQKK